MPASQGEGRGWSWDLCGVKDLVARVRDKVGLG